MMHAVAIVREDGLYRVRRLVAGSAVTLQAHAQALAVRSVSLPCDASRARAAWPARCHTLPAAGAEVRAGGGRAPEKDSVRG